MKLIKSKLVYLITISLITVITAELVLRFILFSDYVKGFENIKDPSLYAKVYIDNNQRIFSDDFWKLYHQFENEYRPPKRSHQTLGWIGNFDRKSLVHNDSPKLNKRRAVLLYGDSFAQCVNATCFQDYLNTDSVFTKEHYFLNYGVGGYGVGQIYTLFSNTAKNYDKPFVIFSIMTHDMERTILTNRIGPKPYFTEENGTLQKKGVPVEENPDVFYTNNPPKICSYLYQLILARFFPEQKLKTGEVCNYKNKIISTNKLLLEEAINDLKQLNTDYLVLIFNPMSAGQYDWRHLWLRKLLDKHQVPHLFTIDLIEKQGYNGGNYELYEQPDNGHPTSYQVELISDELNRIVTQSWYLDTLRGFNKAKLAQYQFDTSAEGLIKRQMEFIRQDKKWFSHIRNKAKTTNREVEDVLREDAMFTIPAAWKEDCIIPEP